MTRFGITSIAFALALLILPAPVVAQEDAQPMLDLGLDQTETIPSQPVKLRIEVLVPTWLAKPIDFPSFEAPNLMVRTLGKATNPISRTINGSTWSGVSRVYQLYPMIPGPVRIPAQDFKVLWAEPGATQPKTSVLKSQPIEIIARLPAGSEDLVPFLAADDIQMTEELSQEPGVLKPGDSLTRSVTVEIQGTSPIFLPQLLPEHDIPGIAVYPSEPEVTETVVDGKLSGQRTESITMIAQSGGSGTVPPLEIRWFNLQTEQIEIIEVPGFELSVDAPVAALDKKTDVRQNILVVSLLLAVAVVCFFLFRTFYPSLRQALDRRRQAHVMSERWALKQARKALSDKTFGQFLVALDLVATRTSATDPRKDPVLEASISELGACIYGAKTTDPSRLWHKVDADLVRACRKSNRDSRKPLYSGALNPVADSST